VTASQSSEPSRQALDLRARLEALRPPPVDPDTIPRRRRVIQIAYEPRVQRALARFAPEVSEITVGGVNCLDIRARGNRPEEPGHETLTILYCFGGGHLGGDARQDMPIIAPLADLTGARIIALNYRTAPENPFPAGLDDLHAVYAALMVETAGRLALIGESAGGNLIMGLLVRAGRLELAMPRAVALLSPWCDLTEQGDPTIPEAALDPTLTTDYLNVASRLYAGDHDRTHPELSPLFATFDASFPPTLITTGSRDRLRPDCEALADRLRAAGVSVDLKVWPGLWHVFEFYDELPEADASLQAIAGFLSDRLA